VLNRRRLTTTLGIGGYDLLDAPPGDAKAPELLFRMRLRYDADYGASAAESDPNYPNSIVPGSQQASVDVMYAYIEGRRLASGWLGFKLGRQYVTDVLGWWSFDGGSVVVTTPYFVKAELYGGLEQRGGMPLSSSRFESDGIWRGDRSGFSPPLYLAFQPATAAPAVGVALESTGVTWIHGRLTYRRVYNTGSSNVTDYKSGLYAPAIYDGMRISSDRLGYAIDANLTNVGGAKAGIVYDFYRDEVTSAFASLDAYAGQKVTISADYDYYVPAFDGDSIFNFFAGEPRNDVGLRANVNVDEKLSVAANGHARIFTVQTEAFNPGATALASNAGAGYYPSNGHPFDEGGSLSARWRSTQTRVELRGVADFGDEGDRAGADLSAEHVIQTRYILRGRAGVWQWNDKLRPDRDTTDVGYVAGLGYRFAARSQGSVEWQHDMNGLVGQRFRLMFLLSLGLSK
jgi:hypothetical protein